MVGAIVATTKAIAINGNSVKKGGDIVDLLIDKNVDEDDLLANYKQRWFDLEDSEFIKIFYSNTGSGKTTRALKFMVQCAIKENKSSVYVAPDVATIKQLEDKNGHYRKLLMEDFNISNDDIDRLFGFYYGDKKLQALTKIKIVTQSKLVHYLEQPSSYLDDDILIIDEAHTLFDDWRKKKI